MLDTAVINFLCRKCPYTETQPTYINNRGLVSFHFSDTNVRYLALNYYPYVHKIITVFVTTVGTAMQHLNQSINMYNRCAMQYLNQSINMYNRCASSLPSITERSAFLCSQTFRTTVKYLTEYTYNCHMTSTYVDLCAPVAAYFHWCWSFEAWTSVFYDLWTSVSRQRFDSTDYCLQSSTNFLMKVGVSALTS
jgi:hypothetical protein